MGRAKRNEFSGMEAALEREKEVSAPEPSAFLQKGLRKDFAFLYFGARAREPKVFLLVFLYGKMVRQFFYAILCACVLIFFKLCGFSFLTLCAFFGGRRGGGEREGVLLHSSSSKNGCCFSLSFLFLLQSDICVVCVRSTRRVLGEE